MHRLFFISLDTPDREYMNCIPKLRRSGACGTARPECACSVQTRQSAARQNHMNPQVLHTEKLFVKKPFRDAVNPARRQSRNAVGADQALGQERPEDFIGLANTFLDCDRPVIAQKGAHRLVRQRHRER